MDRLQGAKNDVEAVGNNSCLVDNLLKDYFLKAKAIFYPLLYEVMVQKTMESIVENSTKALIERENDAFIDVLVVADEDYFETSWDHYFGIKNIYIHRPFVGCRRTHLLQIGRINNEIKVVPLLASVVIVIIVD